MAVFPESMNKLDVNDTTGSLNRIENYIRYMTERVEFSMRNMTRNVSEAGVSSVETLILLNDMASALSIINSTVGGMMGEITSLNTRVGELQNKQNEQSAKMNEVDTKVTTLQSQYAALNTLAAALQSKQNEQGTRLNEMDTKMTDLQNQITELAARVTALEGGTEG